MRLHDVEQPLEGDARRLACDFSNESNWDAEQRPPRSYRRSQAVALEWLRSGRRVVAATIVAVEGSAPFVPGTEMLVDDTGGVDGSVTGGCIDASVVEAAQSVLAGAPSRLLRYGADDDAVTGLTLTCGGTLEIFVRELRASIRRPLEALSEAHASGVPVALVTPVGAGEPRSPLVVFEDRTVGTCDESPLDAAVVSDARRFISDRRTGLVRYPLEDRHELGLAERVMFIESFGCPSLVIVGASELSAAVAKVAVELGYRVSICDPRTALASSPLYSAHAEVVFEWPDRYLDRHQIGSRDALLVLTHDAKLDEPALISGLAGDVGYIGALGSRRTHADRVARLAGAGLARADIARIHSPCGLDIAAQTPMETAVSILAELIASRTGRAGGPLRDSGGPIHPRKAHP